MSTNAWASIPLQTSMALQRGTTKAVKSCPSFTYCCKIFTAVSLSAQARKFDNKLIDSSLIKGENS
eukprot:Gb_17167 [translate_table: standard]